MAATRNQYAPPRRETPRGQTDACENITFPQLRLPAVTITPWRNCLPQVWGRIMFSQVSVILSTEKGVCIGGGLPPKGWVCIEWGLGRPPNRILWVTVNERAVRILLECILVRMPQISHPPSIPWFVVNLIVATKNVGNLLLAQF